MNLAQALKHKKRLAGELARLDGLISQNNSVQKNLRDPAIDVKALLDERTEKMKEIVQLKTAIHLANTHIYKIFLLQELKGLTALLNGLDTTHGVQTGFNQPIEHDAVLKKMDIVEKVKDLEGQIDQLQEEVDYFNHTTSI